MTWGAALPADNVAAGKELQASILTFVVPAADGCNLACPFCYIKQREEEAVATDLSPSDYAGFIVGSLNHQPINFICIQGYEPLLPTSFPYTQQILEKGRRLGIPTSLVTNGTHLRQCVPALSKLRPARIAVSLDSADAAIHDRARGKEGAFDARIVDASGNVYLELTGYRTMQLPDAIDEELLKPLKEIM